MIRSGCSLSYVPEESPYLERLLALAGVCVPVAQGLVRGARDDSRTVWRPMQLENSLQRVDKRVERYLSLLYGTLYHTTPRTESPGVCAMMSAQLNRLNPQNQSSAYITQGHIRLRKIRHVTCTRHALCEERITSAYKVSCCARKMPWCCWWRQAKSTILNKHPQRSSRSCALGGRYSCCILP